MRKKLMGLTPLEVQESLRLHGSNELIEEKKKGFFKRFIENLSDPIIRVLIVALVLNVILSLRNIDYFEVIGILAAVLISTTVSTVSEYKSERAFEMLNKNGGEGTARVLRGDSILELPISDIVVGDIIYLSAGEKIPADGAIIQGRILVDQSTLNGESVEFAKCEGSDRSMELTSDNCVFRGSYITEGEAVMRAVAVGEKTYYGMIARDVQSDKRESPLKLRLSRLASEISKIGYIAAAVVGITYLFNDLVLANNFQAELILAEIKDWKGLMSTVLDALSLMITVVVVAAPEGLPMMITVVLSANMKRMLADKILVKRSVGIETAGSLNILFTDKTGTVTQGRPECERIITYNTFYKNPRALRTSSKIYEYLNLSARYNTDVVNNNGDLVGGNSTDRGIYSFFMSEPEIECEVKRKCSFSSDKKYSSVELTIGITLIKGAAERIINASRFALNEQGQKVAFDRDKIYRSLLECAERGERVIAVAMYGDGNADELTFIALIVMKDKIRRGVREAVDRVHGAGIQVVMITGDSKETACAIARECGIMSGYAGHIVLSSDELAMLDDDELKAILPKIRVISRAKPRDKTRLVRAAQELGLVTGMTGDGINDAPSLKLSDVGFAMGDGTEIAKSAADIVILDNSLLAISKTVLYGRTIFKSIRKFITFQLIMNLCACAVSFLGQFMGVDTPITIVQMLWVNIIMDTLGGLAFAGEPAMEYYMSESPKRRDEPILTSQILKNIFITGAYTLCVCILFLTSPVIRSMYGAFKEPSRYYTAFYALFIFSGVFNCLCARSERLWLFSGIVRNKLFVLILLLICAIQMLMIYFGGTLFRCVPLVAGEISFVFLLASSVVPFDMIRRLAERLK